VYRISCQRKGDPIILDLYAHSWNWSTGKVINGYWEIEKPEEVKALLDDLLAREKQEDKVQKNLGEKTIEILKGATKVEVFRIEGGGGPQAKADTIGPDRRQYRIVATGKEQGKEFAAKVREFLFDEGTTIPSGVGGFSQGDVAFRLWKDKESVAVVLCF